MLLGRSMKRSRPMMACHIVPGLALIVLASFAVALRLCRRRVLGSGIRRLALVLIRRRLTRTLLGLLRLLSGFIALRRL